MGKTLAYLFICDETEAYKPLFCCIFKAIECHEERCLQQLAGTRLFPESVVVIAISKLNERVKVEA